MSYLPSVGSSIAVLTLDNHNQQPSQRIYRPKSGKTTYIENTPDRRTYNDDVLYMRAHQRHLRILEEPPCKDDSENPCAFVNTDSEEDSEGLELEETSGSGEDVALDDAAVEGQRAQVTIPSQSSNSWNADVVAIVSQTGDCSSDDAKLWLDVTYHVVKISHLELNRSEFENQIRQDHHSGTLVVFGATDLSTHAGETMDYRLYPAAL